jgi:hypothetical protein
MTKFAHLIVLCSLAFSCFAKNSNKKSLTVRAVAFTSRTNERTSSYTTPGTSNTNCSGSGTTIGNTTNASVNCQTTSTPAQTHQINSRTIDVMNIVEADGMRYTIVCRASWVGSNCAPLIAGDVFRAEIDNRTMWLMARKGGNQGKEVKMKNKILDIRPAPSN